MFEALPAGRPLPGLYWRGHSIGITSVPYMEMGMGLEQMSGGLERREWQLSAELDAWPVETSRRTPHCATSSRDIKKKCVIKLRLVWL
jgi:hypothetical protein